MTPAETALAFAKEIMGWDEVYGPFPNDRDSPCGSKDGEYEVFRPKDLNAIMEAARDWCRSQGLEFLLTYTPAIVYVQTSELAGWQYVVNIQPPGSPYELLGAAFGDDPCEALMRACLGAAAKQRTGS